VKDLLEFLVRSLVDKPDEVRIESFEEDDGTIVFEIGVADDEVGLVIGRGGRTINAVRSVIRAASIKDEKRVLIDVVDGD
jgi:predicted RNA-binding protein YlqC (UPF0109 family)